MSVTIREYQQDGIDRITQAAVDGARRILFQCPTGGGKTIIASKIIEHALSTGNKVLFLAHRRELVVQCQEKLAMLGITSGVIMGGEFHDPTEPVQVCSVQSLHRRGVQRKSIKLPTASLVVVDEAHHTASSKTWIDVLKGYPESFILGLTATPINRRGQGLAGHFDQMVCSPTISELTNLGHLVPARYFVPSIPDLRGIKVRGGDYVEEELANRMDQPELIGDILLNWSRICPDRRTLVFATSVKHSVHLAESFRTIGIKAEHIDGDTPQEERDARVKAFKDGEIQVLCNCAVFTEGFDAPEASALVFARPTKSLSMYLQVAGRVLRPAPGKADCIIVDHAGVVYEHGKLDQDFDWKLEYGDGQTINTIRAAKKKVKAKREITCEKCKYVYEGQLACPFCGAVPKINGKSVPTYEAYLQELTDLEKPKGTENERDWWAMLRGYAIKHEYKTGWAYHKFIEKFGHKPAWGWNSDSAQVPALDVAAWIRSRQIAWAKRREVTAEQMGLNP